MLVEYLGSAGAPKPFGGRSEAFRELDDWLNHPTQPRRLLLWAPGGRGKTALLVRWVQQLPESLDKVFVPISIRAGTNLEEVFYEAMVARLATILGEPAPPSADRHHTRVRMHDYLARFTDPQKPCLVVIDGLDEATGWTVTPAMLPLDPPAGLRIVVSARLLLEDDRDRGWRGRLGWTNPATARSIEVPPLSADGIADVLARMGLQTIAKDREIVSRLFVLTESGQPLLVELYATDLRDPAFVERLHRADARDLIPGLKGFFERWFADQEVIWKANELPIDVDEVYAALTILAGAVGALRPLDISDIAAHAGLKVRAEALKAIERFVVRFDRADSAAKQAVVLTHPRFGEFLWRESLLTQIYVPKVEKAFLAWGAAAVAAVNDTDGDPAQVPYYLLVYYLQHLGRSGAAAPLERFRALADDGWRRACSEYGGGEGSLVEQLDTCLARLVKAGRAKPDLLNAPRTGLGGIIHIALCLASLRSLGSSFPPNIMAEMVRVDLLKPRRALFLTRGRRDSERAATIAALAAVFVNDDLPLLETEARQLKAAEHRVTALLGVARDPSRNRFPLVLEAIAIAAQQTEESSRRNAIRRCLEAAGEFEVEQEEAAFTAAEPLIGPENLPPRRPRAAQSAETPAPSTTAKVPRQDALPPREFRADFSPTDFVRQNSWRLRDLPDELKAECQRLAGISAAEATPSDLEAALTLAFALAPLDKVSLVLALACYLDTDLLMRAIDQAVENGNNYWLGELLLPLAVRLEPDARIALIERLLGLPITFETGGGIAKLLPLLTDQQLDRLWPSIARLTPSHGKKGILTIMLDRVDAGQLNLLVDAAIPSDKAENMVSFYRGAEIGLIIDRLSSEQLGRLYEQTLATEAVDKFAYLLKEIAPLLSQDRLERAIDHAFTIEPGYYRNERLALLLPLAAKREPAVIEHALAVAQAMPSASNRLELLEVLLPHLPIERRRDVLLEQRHQVFAINDRPVVSISLAALDQMPDLTDAAAFADPSQYDHTGSIVLALLPLLPRIDNDRARDAVQMAEDRLDHLDADDRRMVTLLIALCPKLSPIKGAKYAQAAFDLIRSPYLPALEFGHIGSLLLFSPYLTAEQAQRLLGRLASIMRDEAAELDLRLTIAVFLAEAPQVTYELAFDAIKLIETTVAAPATPALTKALLLAARHLCRRGDAAPLPAFATLPTAETQVEHELLPQDLARFGTLPYRNGPDLRARTLDLAERLARMRREGALSLLALIEGSWGDTLKLRSSLGGAQRVLERAGGPHAVTETIDAIRSVAEWWP